MYRVVTEDMKISTTGNCALHFLFILYATDLSPLHTNLSGENTMRWKSNFHVMGIVYSQCLTGCCRTCASVKRLKRVRPDTRYNSFRFSAIFAAVFFLCCFEFCGWMLCSEAYEYLDYVGVRSSVANITASPAT